MRLITGVPIVLMLLAASCSAQISIGGRNIDFGVKRKKPSSPTVKLLNPATYTAGTTVSIHLKVADFDESKGFSVYTRTPCHSQDKVEKIGDGVYKIDLVIDDTEANGSCQVSLHGLAKNDGASVDVAYQQDPALRAMRMAAYDSFVSRKTWALKHPNGSTSTLTLMQIPGMPKPEAKPNGDIGLLLTDPKTSEMITMLLTRPDKILLSSEGCQMEGTLSGTTATLKPMTSYPGNKCSEGELSLQAR
jgi:hypothetical protein